MGHVPHQTRRAGLCTSSGPAAPGRVGPQLSRLLGIWISQDAHYRPADESEEGIRVVRVSPAQAPGTLAPSQKVRDLRIWIFTILNFEKQSFIPFELTNSSGLDSSGFSLEETWVPCPHPRREGAGGCGAAPGLPQPLSLCPGSAGGRYEPWSFPSPVTAEEPAFSSTVCKCSRISRPEIQGRKETRTH